MRLIDELFSREAGYVLDVSNKTFAEFFRDELGIDIDEQRWFEEGTSKAKRLRYFLKQSDPDTAVKTLRALWEYRTIHDRKAGLPAADQDTYHRFVGLVERVRPGSTKPAAPPKEAPFDFKKCEPLKGRLLDLRDYAPQPRGFAFEKWLADLFNLFGLEARNAFKNRGEQIDGSFVLGNEIYLLEAKWQDQATSAADLHVFHGKITQKAAWTRGLFVSNSGFSTDGLSAFGRGKSLVCMDGLDLFDMLNSKITLTKVLEQKVRRASETGNPFVRVRELFHI